MQVIVAGLAVAAFVVAAFGDIKNRRIPNGLVLAIGVLGIARLTLAGDFGAGAMTLLAAAAVLAVGFLLFWRGLIGGGDAKLLATATLLVGYHDLFGFLFLMSLCGGVLAAAVLAQHRIRPWAEAFVLALAVWGMRSERIVPEPRASVALNAGDGAAAPLSVPYGVAIAAAGIITLGLQTVPPQLLL
jgi:prepilin peptidase CpaA